MINEELRIIESPRDAMQGIQKPIPLSLKVRYIQSLIQANFDVLDVGSFVSPRAIPQLADTRNVLKAIDKSRTDTLICVLAANEKGVREAAECDEVDVISFPFSASSGFLRRNIRSTPDEAYKTIMKSTDLCIRKGKKMIVYMTMAFGNPYDEQVPHDTLMSWVERIWSEDVFLMSFSDIIGVADPTQISKLFGELRRDHPAMRFGIHLHVKGNNSFELLQAAHSAGCRWFDSVTGGAGGCPMTGYEMVKNLDTADLLEFARIHSLKHQIDEIQFRQAGRMALQIFSEYR